MGKPTTRFHVLRAGGYIGYEPPKKGADMSHLRDCIHTNCNKLLPPGVMEERPQVDLQALQALANRGDMLLPTPFNRRPEPAKAKDADSDNMLLPVGMGR